MNCKTEWAYWIVLNQIIIVTQLILYPDSVTCDFERGLINAVTHQFRDISVVGCLFHFKKRFEER
jgi:hypothetical protein